MLAHIVTAANRSSYAAVLEEMFRQRHAVFVNHKGWRELDVQNGCERDEFDTDDAVYLLAINDVGDLEASLRLIPSEKPHLLKTLAARWDITDLPAGFGVWEWSRYLPGRPGMSRQRLAHSRAVLITGALEFARMRGVGAYTACCDAKRFGMFAELGWGLEFLSGLYDYGQGRAAAVKWNVGQAELDFARSHFGIIRSVIVEMPPRPAQTDLHYLHFAVAAELWELNDPHTLSGALLDLTRHAALSRALSANGGSARAPIVVPGVAGRA